jgi:HlyD family secretion protein
LTREVKVGHRTGLAAEILSGLSVGEEVISHPDNSIENGIRVRSR